MSPVIKGPFAESRCRCHWISPPKVAIHQGVSLKLPLLELPKRGHGGHPEKTGLEQISEETRVWHFRDPNIDHWFPAQHVLFKVNTEIQLSGLLLENVQS